MTVKRDTIIGYDLETEGDGVRAKSYEYGDGETQSKMRQHVLDRMSSQRILPIAIIVDVKPGMIGFYSKNNEEMLEAIFSPN